MRPRLALSFVTLVLSLALLAAAGCGAPAVIRPR